MELQLLIHSQFSFILRLSPGLLAFDGAQIQLGLSGKTLKDIWSYVNTTEVLTLVTARVLAVNKQWSQCSVIYSDI
jgi:hypothetical protein